MEQVLPERRVVRQPDDEAYLQRAHRGQPLRRLHAGGRRPHRREAVRRILGTGHALSTDVHTGVDDGGSEQCAEDDRYRPGNLYAWQCRQRRLCRGSRCQDDSPLYPHCGADSLLARYHKAHRERGHVDIRLRVLLVRQHEPHSLDYQADRGPDEHRARHQGGGRTDDSAGRGQHPLLLLGVAQPLQLYPGSVETLLDRGPEPPYCRPAQARPPEGGAGHYLRGSHALV